MGDWAKLKVVDLKAELKRRDLNVNGLKADLVERLQADDAVRVEDGPVKGHEDGQAEAAEAEVEAEGEEEQFPTPAADAASHNEAQEAAVDASIQQAADDEATRRTTVTQASNEVTGATTAPITEAAIEPTETDDLPVTDSKAQEVVTSLVAQTPQDKDVTSETSANLPSPESQKRKRRSQSPPPIEEDVARKRARAESEAHPRNGVMVDSDAVIMSDAPPPRSSREASKSRGPAISAPSQTLSPNRGEDEMDYERDVAPARHPATSALYINNLMRPLRPADLRAHLASLVSSNASPDDVITTFFLDQIRTHALVIFNSTTSASRVRTALHDRVWPEESNRKALSVDFVPPEKVADWIQMEEGAGRGARTGSRWEVVYETLSDGTVEVHLESGSVSASRPGPPPPTGPSPYDGTNSIPLGPRGFRDDPNPPPTGPRSSREQFQREPPSQPPPGSLATRARPVISFQPVSSSVAKRRLENMQSHYTRDTRRYLGREINRYSFEDGDKFVDRGKEVFEGIRPPHKERGGGGFRGRGAGGRRGGARGRGRGGDRYMPPGRGRGGEEEGRLPRYADDR